MTPDIRPAPPTLTARQQEVAALVAEGLSNQAIAARLDISRRTVEAHLAMIALRLPGNTSPRERIMLYVLSQMRDGQPHKEAA